MLNKILGRNENGVATNTSANTGTSFWDKFPFAAAVKRALSKEEPKKEEKPITEPPKQENKNSFLNDWMEGREKVIEGPTYGGYLRMGESVIYDDDKVLEIINPLKTPISDLKDYSRKGGDIEAYIQGRGRLLYETAKKETTIIENNGITKTYPQSYVKMKEEGEDRLVEIIDPVTKKPICLAVLDGVSEAKGKEAAEFAQEKLTEFGHTLKQKEKDEKLSKDQLKQHIRDNILRINNELLNQYPGASAALAMTYFPEPESNIPDGEQDVLFVPIGDSQLYKVTLESSSNKYKLEKISIDHNVLWVLMENHFKDIPYDEKREKIIAVQSAFDEIGPKQDWKEKFLEYGGSDRRVISQRDAINLFLEKVAPEATDTDKKTEALEKFRLVREKIAQALGTNIREVLQNARLTLPDSVLPKFSRDKLYIQVDEVRLKKGQGLYISTDGNTDPNTIGENEVIIDTGLKNGAQKATICKVISDRAVDNNHKVTYERSKISDDQSSILYINEEKAADVSPTPTASVATTSQPITSPYTTPTGMPIPPVLKDNQTKGLPGDTTKNTNALNPNQTNFGMQSPIETQVNMLAVNASNAENKKIEQKITDTQNHTRSSFGKIITGVVGATAIAGTLLASYFGGVALFGGGKNKPPVPDNTNTPSPVTRLNETPNPQPSSTPTPSATPQITTTPPAVPEHTEGTVSPNPAIAENTPQTNPTDDHSKKSENVDVDQQWKDQFLENYFQKKYPTLWASAVQTAKKMGKTANEGNEMLKTFLAGLSDEQIKGLTTNTTKDFFRTTLPTAAVRLKKNGFAHTEELPILFKNATTGNITRHQGERETLTFAVLVGQESAKMLEQTLTGKSSAASFDNNPNRNDESKTSSIQPEQISERDLVATRNIAKKPNKIEEVNVSYIASTKEEVENTVETVLPNIARKLRESDTNNIWGTIVREVSNDDTKTARKVYDMMLQSYPYKQTLVQTAIENGMMDKKNIPGIKYRLNRMGFNTERLETLLPALRTTSLEKFSPDNQKMLFAAVCQQPEVEKQLKNFITNLFGAPEPRV